MLLALLTVRLNFVVFVELYFDFIIGNRALESSGTVIDMPKEAVTFKVGVHHGAIRSALSLAIEDGQERDEEKGECISSSREDFEKLAEA